MCGGLRHEAMCAMISSGIASMLEEMLSLSMMKNALDDTLPPTLQSSASPTGVGSNEDPRPCDAKAAAWAAAPKNNRRALQPCA